MTLAMVAKITFAKAHGRAEIVVRKPNAVKIDSSWKMLTDTASIILPRNVSYFDKHQIRDVFKNGDPVLIELGYNGNYVKEFSGYITRVSAGIPIVIECEDEMYKLKRIPVNISLRKTTLPKLLKQIVPGYEINALEIEMGAQRFSNVTVSAVLEYLKQDYALYSYMKNGVLLVGKIYQDDSNDDNIELHLEKNVVDNALNYKNEEDVIIKIKAISTLFTGDKIEVTVGDDDGEIRQLSYYGIKLKEELKKLAEADLKKYKVDGYDGSVETFGIPFIKHGDKINLKSDLYPDRSGLYYVEKVQTIFDDSPQYHRTVTLGEKVTA